MSRTRIEHNLATGQVATVEVDNAWILANRPSTVHLSASALSVAVNGTITLSAQLKTPELADFSQQNLTDNRPIQLRLGDTIQSINLVNGFFSDSLPFILAGTYRLECLDLPSNVLVIEVS